MQGLESLKTVFKDRLFKIPDYQRGYAWAERQLKDFWEDVVNLPTDRFHYTGLLSLKKVDRKVWNSWNEERLLMEERSYNPFHVVDGQQRLTTFVIFIQAITELLISLPENVQKKEEDIYLGSFSLKAIKEDYLVIQKPPQFIVSSYKFSYEVDNPSFRFLKYRIFNEEDSGTIQETFYTLNLENAKQFFADNLKNYYEKDGIAEIESLFKKLTQNLMFNVYEISEDFDVFVAFETMNNRGKKLSNLELLKNRLIYLTTLYDENELQQDERYTLREKINDAWKEVYYQLGRNKQTPLNDDDFLFGHWIMYFQYSREKGDDYIRFLLEDQFTPQNIYTKTDVKVSALQRVNEVREQVASESEDAEDTAHEVVARRSKLSPTEIKEYVNSLKSAAVHWYNSHNPVGNSDLTDSESLWMDRLNRLGMTYFRPLVTASFLSPEMNAAKRVGLFEGIERFLFVCLRLGRAPASYRDSEFYRASRQLRIHELTSGDIVSRLNDLVGEYYYQPENALTDEWFFDYDYFRKFLEKKFKSGGGFYHWNGLRYFLYEYEWEKVRERGSQKIDWKLFTKGEKDKVSIEHIYPQTPDNECWKDSFKGFKESQQVVFQGTLGNLLPLSLSINSSLQNDCFLDKRQPKYNAQKEKIRQGYSNGSHSEIEVSTNEAWNPETILQRGLHLLAFMEKRWNIKFEDDYIRAKLLFLEFMLPEPLKAVKELEQKSPR